MFDRAEASQKDRNEQVVDEHCPENRRVGPGLLSRPAGEAERQQGDAKKPPQRQFRTQAILAQAILAQEKTYDNSGNDEQSQTGNGFQHRDKIKDLPHRASLMAITTIIKTFVFPGLHCTDDVIRIMGEWPDADRTNQNDNTGNALRRCARLAEEMSF